MILRISRVNFQWTVKQIYSPSELIIESYIIMKNFDAFKKNCSVDLFPLVTI